MQEGRCRGIEAALDALDAIAPDVPLLALGQTIFWDEPMKAGVALSAASRANPRPFVAGIHDTDYFAKLPAGPRQPGSYRSLPHNDTTTRGLWSAAAEFSALFGSETVITRELLQSAGVRLATLQRARPSLLDEATEAWGWRGIVSLDEHPPIAAEVPIRSLFRELVRTMDWAIDLSRAHLPDPEAATRADALHALVCDAELPPGETLGTFYQKLLEPVYEFVANQPVPMSVTATTELLRLNRETADRPRFRFLDLFLRPESRSAARVAYDRALQGGSGQYELARFGSGAIPFDLVIPGHGRGTIRIGNRGVVIMTPTPQFLSLERPLRDVADFADRLERKFGPNCVVVGKAVALIGMLAREFAFVFHEGASSYVRHSRALLSDLRRQGFDVVAHPILRVRYSLWDSLEDVCRWVRLPEPLRRPYGTEELCTPSLANRWREVAAEQERLLTSLAAMRRPLDLIEFFDLHLGGAWRAQAKEYRRLRESLESLQRQLAQLDARRHALYDARRTLRQSRVQAERALGEHWRATHFERIPSDAEQAERAGLLRARDEVLRAIEANRTAFATLRRERAELVQHPEVRQVHARRHQVELEAELTRVRLVREAIIASRGMRNANFRPGAWWLPLLSPDGAWFRATQQRAEAYLEPLLDGPEA
ncbi:MAG: hypothetical protein SFX74_08530 [Fimbriimonadaceae bacterium]|nr:hypothetical protein [Fimbriimonadaceae bacterium]